MNIAHYTMGTHIDWEKSRPKRHLWLDSLLVPVLLDMHKRCPQRYGQRGQRELGRVNTTVKQVHHFLNKEIQYQAYANDGFDIRFPYHELDHSAFTIPPPSCGLNAWFTSTQPDFDHYGAETTTSSTDDPIDTDFAGSPRYEDQLKWLWALLTYVRCTRDSVPLAWATQLARNTHIIFGSRSGSLATGIKAEVQGEDRVLAIEACVTFLAMQCTSQEILTIGTTESQPLMQEIHDLQQFLGDNDELVIIDNNLLLLANLIVSSARLTLLLTRGIGSERFLQRILRSVIVNCAELNFDDMRDMKYTDRREPIAELYLATAMQGLEIAKDALEKTPSSGERSTQIRQIVNTLSRNFRNIPHSVSTFWHYRRYDGVGVPLSARDAGVDVWKKNKQFHEVMMALANEHNQMALFDF